MKKIASAFGLVTLLSASVALAAGWSNYLTIDTLEIDAVTSGNSQTFLTFTTTPTGKPSCATTGGILAGSTDSVKAMTTLANSAFLSGRTLRVYWDGTCDSTFTSYGKVAAVQIK